MIDLQNLGCYQENQQIEAKQALGGLPESLWETYSAFANTDGGLILLGVEELPDKSLHAMDLLDPHWLLEDFWAIINDPLRVSANILRCEDVRMHQVDGKCIISIAVPKAQPNQMPIYIDNDPFRGSYRRMGEGDFRFTPEEVTAMLQKHSNVEKKV